MLHLTLILSFFFCCCSCCCFRSVPLVAFVVCVLTFSLWLLFRFVTLRFCVIFLQVVLFDYVIMLGLLLNIELNVTCHKFSCFSFFLSAAAAAAAAA